MQFSITIDVKEGADGNMLADLLDASAASACELLSERLLQVDESVDLMGDALSNMSGANPACAMFKSAQLFRSE